MVFSKTFFQNHGVLKECFQRRFSYFWTSKTDNMGIYKYLQTSLNTLWVFLWVQKVFWWILSRGKFTVFKWKGSKFSILTKFSTVVPGEPRKNLFLRFFANIFLLVCRMITIFLLTQRARLSGPFRYLEHVRKVNKKFSRGLWKKVSAQKMGGGGKKWSSKSGWNILTNPHFLGWNFFKGP